MKGRQARKEGEEENLPGSRMEIFLSHTELYTFISLSALDLSRKAEKQLH